MKISDYNLTELIALNQCADMMVTRYTNLFEIHRGNHYGDVFNSEKERTNIIEKLDVVKRKKELILDEIEKRLCDVED